MALTQLTVRGDIGGQPMNGVIEVTTDTGSGTEITIPAAKAATLSTRTDDNTGTLTLSSGHGLVDGNVVDVFWEGGFRYGMTLASTGATSSVADGGAGDILPAQGTAVTVCKQVIVNLDFLGDEVLLMGIICAARGVFQILDGSTVEQVFEVQANSPRLLLNTEIATLLAGLDIDSCRMSQASTAAAVMRVGIARNAQGS